MEMRSQIEDASIFEFRWRDLIFLGRYELDRQKIGWLLVLSDNMSFVARPGYAGMTKVKQFPTSMTTPDC
jgi:hypothetical protein